MGLEGQVKTSSGPAPSGGSRAGMANLSELSEVMNNTVPRALPCWARASGLLLFGLLRSPGFLGITELREDPVPAVCQHTCTPSTVTTPLE